MKKKKKFNAKIFVLCVLCEGAFWLLLAITNNFSFVDLNYWKEKKISANPKLSLGRITLGLEPEFKKEKKLQISLANNLEKGKIIPEPVVAEIKAEPLPVEIPKSTSVVISVPANKSGEEKANMLVAYVMSKKHCANGNDHPSKSDTKGKHQDEDCCPDPDEWPNPQCAYLGKDLGIMRSVPRVAKK